MGKVIHLKGETTLDIPVERVLDGAKEVCKTAVVLGITHDGKGYFASSIGRSEDIIWLLERLKFVMLYAAHTGGEE